MAVAGNTGVEGQFRFWSGAAGQAVLHVCRRCTHKLLQTQMLYAEMSVLFASSYLIWEVSC